MTLPDQLLAALRDFESAVESARTGERPDLQSHFRRIDDLAARLPDDADPRLRHFLDQKSYQKALALLAAQAGG